MKLGESNTKDMNPVMVLEIVINGGRLYVKRSVYETNARSTPT